MSNNDDFPSWTRALASLGWSFSFWANLLYEMLKLKVTDDLPTLAVGGGYLYVNKGYFDDPKFNDQNRIFMVAHEISHEMYFHPSMMRTYHDTGVDGEPFDQARFNVAADFVINAGLVKFRVGEYHKDWLLNDEFKWDDNVLDVYRRLKPKDEPDKPQDGDPCDDGDPQDGDGDSSGGAGKPGDIPSEGNPDVPGGGVGGYDILDRDDHSMVVGEVDAGQRQHDTHAFDQVSEYTEQDWKQAVAGAHQQAKAIGHGNAAFNRMIDEYLTPKRDWKQELRDYVTVRRGRDEASRRRIHKRKLYERGIVMPVKESFSLGKLLIVHDVSGSVSDEEHSLCKGTGLEIFSQCRPKHIRVLCVACNVIDQPGGDVSYDAIEEYEAWNPVGNGGTDMEAAFRYVLEDNWIPDLAIVLTDGWTDFTEAPPFPVVWLSTDKGEDEFPYGRAIKIEAA